jgi:hypothetical protein
VEGGWREAGMMDDVESGWGSASRRVVMDLETYPSTSTGLPQTMHTWASSNMVPGGGVGGTGGGF